MLQGRETLCLREDGMEILKRAKTAMIRAMCDTTFNEKTNAKTDGFVGLNEWIAMVWACFEEKK